MKTKALFAIALMFALSFAAVIPMDDSDATLDRVTLENGSTISVEKGDTVTLVLAYRSTGPTTCDVSIYDVSDSKNPVYTKHVTFKSGEFSLEIPMKFDGSYNNMKITFTNGSLFVYEPITFSVSYTSSIWSNPAVYVAIVIVVILIIAFVVYKSRTAPKRDKNTLTFEQIEAERQAQKAASSSPKKEPAPSAAKSERQRYLASKKKKE